VLTFALRRTVTQARLLLGVVALVTVGTALLGIGALLLGTTQDRAFAAGVQEAPSQDVEVTAFLVGLTASDEVAARDAARGVIDDVLGPFDPAYTTNATSRMRRLADGERIGYLASTDSLDRRAALISGRWAAAPGEAVVPQSTADRLDLALGARVTLGKEIGTHPVDRPVTVVVVGTFRPTSRSGWQGDPLGASGYRAAYSDGSLPEPTAAFGPFVVDDATLLSSGSTVDALQVTGHPRVDRATDRSMSQAAHALRSADGLLSARVGDRVSISRIASDLSPTLSRIHAQQAATRSTVLVVLLLCTLIALIALLLAGRLLGSVRGTERALLADLGLSRAQQGIVTGIEALAIAGVATVLAVPAAALAHAAVTHLPAMTSAGLAQGPVVTSGLVLTEIVGAILLALALVVPMLGQAVPGPRFVKAIRSGVDLVLVVVAVAAWWQLRSQPDGVSSGDATRTLAPVVCVAAVTLVAVRSARSLLSVVAWIANRSTTLVVPLATSQAARRPYAGAALMLLAMSVASATFGLAVQTTWERSQVDQAALRVGTDLTLALSAPATDRDAAAILAATGRATSSAVIDRPLALGRYVGPGDADSAPVLVAADSRRSGALLRGRLDRGRTWSGVGELLAPGPPASGLPLSSAGVTVKGSAPTGAAVEVTPTLVLQDSSGFRRTETGAAVPLDGRSHRLRELTGTAGSRLVAARLTLRAGAAPQPGPDPEGEGRVSVILRAAGPDSPADALRDWHVHSLDAEGGPVVSSTVTAQSTAGGAWVRTAARLDLGFLSLADAELLSTSFDAPPVLPVAVSRKLADTVGTKVGGELSATVDGVGVPVRVVAVIPAVPSAPGRVAVLADADTLSRMLITAGHLEPAVDAWWIADPAPRVTRALDRLDLGDTTTRTGVAAQLARGPLRATVPAALSLLVVAAGLMLLAGAALVVGADRPSRSAEAARLRALGVTRRQATWLALTEHAVALTAVVIAGALAGALTSVALGPSLIRSDVGVAPVPAAVVVWPWARELAAVAGLLGACLVIAAVITVLAVRRSGSAQLRVGDA
jgi:hypothetical protein